MPFDQRAYNAAYYRANRESEITRVVLRQRAALELLRDLRRVACVDCGGVFPPYVMDFDHRDPTTKSFSLAAGHALLKTRAVLLAEVAKCDVVCANCHRVRTVAARLSGKLRPYGFQRSSEPATTPGVQRRREAWHHRREEQTRLLDEYRDRPCADCGENYPRCVMDFDHRDPSQKHYTVSQMPGRVRLATLLAEIAKCDIVCANCHRIRTYRRRVVEHSRQLQLLEERGAYAA